MHKYVWILIFWLYGPAVRAQNPTYVLAFLHTSQDKEKLTEVKEKEIQKAHLANIDRLFRAGIILISGPFSNGGGMFVLKVNSVDEAKEVLETDPGIQAKRWKLELMPFKISGGSMCAAPEPYVMVSYQFVRYSTTNPVANYKANDEFISENSASSLQGIASHQGGLLLACSFHEGDGGVLIFTNKSAVESMNADPLVTSGHLTLEHKVLYIARGSFCEN